MHVRAHVLLQVDPGRSREAADYLAALPSVLGAAATSGAYDVIATVQAESEAALRGTLALARRTPGLCALRLCRGSASDDGLRTELATAAAAPA